MPTVQYTVYLYLVPIFESCLCAILQFKNIFSKLNFAQIVFANDMV